MRLKLKFVGENPVPLKTVTAFMDAVDEELRKTEIDGIRSIRDRFPEIPQIAVDAALYRATSTNFRPDFSVSKVEAVRQGSVEFLVVGVALSYWLLNLTIGETLKEAWKESALHRQFKLFLLRGQKEKLETAIEQIKDSRHSRVAFENLAVTNIAENFNDPDAPTLDVEIEVVEPVIRPPTYAELADEYNRTINK